MNLPVYISVEEVQRVCRELGLRDWTQLSEPVVLTEEAARIRAEVGGEALLISEGEFHKGLEVELEHGIHFYDTNVTNNHPILTGRIVVAHLKESLDYYLRLKVAELEGDLVKQWRLVKATRLFASTARWWVPVDVVAQHDGAEPSGRPPGQPQDLVGAHDRLSPDVTNEMTTNTSTNTTRHPVIHRPRLRK